MRFALDEESSDELVASILGSDPTKSSFLRMSISMIYAPPIKRPSLLRALATQLRRAEFTLESCVQLASLYKVDAIVPHSSAPIWLCMVEGPRDWVRVLEAQEAYKDYEGRSWDLRSMSAIAWYLEGKVANGMDTSSEVEGLIPTLRTPARTLENRILWLLGQPVTVRDYELDFFSRGLRQIKSPYTVEEVALVRAYGTPVLLAYLTPAQINVCFGNLDHASIQALTFNAFDTRPEVTTVLARLMATTMPPTPPRPKLQPSHIPLKNQLQEIIQWTRDITELAERIREREAR